MTSLDFNHIYALLDLDQNRALRVRTSENLGNLRFPLVTGQYFPNRPIVFNWARGSVPKDLVGTGYPGVYLFSSRLLSVLAEHEFTGWSTWPVEVYGGDGEPLEGYQGFAVTGRCGPIDKTLSKRVWRDPPTRTGRPYEVCQGVLFDPDTWDGSDIFTPKETLWKMVTERVKRALEGARVSNVLFKKITEVESMVF